MVVATPNERNVEVGDQPWRSRPFRRIGVGGFRIDDRAKELVLQVLDSNRLTAGPMMDAFESQIARLHGCRFGLMSNSGTSSLQIAVATLRERYGWQEGDEILVPALTFIATSNVVLYNGLRPVFVDVDPSHYTIDPGQIEAKITPRTRAIIPVHVAGQPAEMVPIQAIAEEHGLRIIEDSAETMFVRDAGRWVGSFGDIGCFSTYAAHMISTGVGGLAITNDPDLIVILKSLMNHGRDSIYIRIDDDENATGDALFRIADIRFSFVRLGHSFRATELEAAIGLAQLEDRDRTVTRRRLLADRITAELEPLADRLQLPKVRPGSEHSYMFYPMTILDGSIDRSELIRYLEDAGIETRYLLPLINQPVYRQLFGDIDAEYPVAARLNQRAFYVGCHPDMSDEDADYLVDRIWTFFESRAA